MCAYCRVDGRAAVKTGRLAVNSSKAVVAAWHATVARLLMTGAHAE
jgi:hypothetical protein